MTEKQTPATVEGARHHRASVNGTELHYVELGETGSPVMLIHGFPETWYAFRKLMPLLAKNHRVIAVDLRGFGDSATHAGPFDRATTAEDLKHLVDHLGYGPVHITGQDLGGPTVYTLAATAPDRVRSVTFVEVGLHGCGLEQYMDVTKGGSWHFGFFGGPYSPMLVKGHERELLESLAYNDYVDDRSAVTSADIDEFVRTYARPDGFLGTQGLYHSQVNDGEALAALTANKLQMPLLAIGGSGQSGFGDHTAETAALVASDVRKSVLIQTGHFVAQESPQALVDELLPFFRQVDAG